MKIISDKQANVICYRRGVLITATPREKLRMLKALAESLQEDGYDMYRVQYAIRSISKGGVRIGSIFDPRPEK